MSTLTKATPTAPNATPAIPRHHTKSQPEGQPTEGPVNKAMFGMLMFIAAEVMIFAGLITVFYILRASADLWPPPGQPYLPVAVTAVNTLFLLASSFSMQRAQKSFRTAGKRTNAWLAFTAGLGCIFLFIQGSEWVRLVDHGLTFVSSVYGSIFYTLIGFHGLHVFGAVMALLLVQIKHSAGGYTQRHRAGFVLCGMYWYFVVAIWPVLYVLVYLK